MKRDAVALVDEPRCIGCTLCIEACPYDAIAGAQGLMHTVIASYCTGCKLCVPACPVDCIDMVAPTGPWGAAQTRAAGARALSRQKRIRSEKPVSRTIDRKAVIASILKRTGR